MLFTIEGMTCGRCVGHVTQALQRVAPAARVSVDLAAGTALVDGPVDPAQAIAAVAGEGYAARVAAAPVADSAASTCCGSCRA